MLEHLVKGHLGGHYISDADPEFIESYCETCGDYDMILTSWDNCEEDSRLNALLKYFMSSNLSNREDIDRKVEEYCCWSIDNKDIIPSLLYDIENNYEEISSIISYLYEGHSISENEYNKFNRILNFEKERQTKMVKHFAKSMFIKDKEGNVKVLKLLNTRIKK